MSGWFTVRARRARWLSVGLVIATLLASVPVIGDAQDGDGDQAGVDGATYASPTYDYTLAWDAAWQVTEAVSAGGEDRLVLDNGASVVTLRGFASADEPAACVAAAVDALGQGGATDVAVARNGTGDPLAGSDELGAYATYNYAAAGSGEPRSRYFDCRPLVPGQALLLITQDVALDAYNDQLAPRRALLDSLTMNDAADVESERTAAEESGQWPSLRWSVSIVEDADDRPFVYENFGWEITGAEYPTLVSSDGIAYLAYTRGVNFNSSSAWVIAIDIATGDLRWSAKVGDIPPIGVIAGQGVVTAVCGGRLVALDGATGEILWERAAQADYFSSPTLADGAVIVDEVDDLGATIHAFELMTGDERWSARIGQVEAYALPVSDDAVFASDTDGNVYAFRLDTGEQRWQTPADASGTSPVVVEAGAVYTPAYTTQDDGTIASYVVAIDAETGQERWRLPTTSFVPPIVAGDMVFSTEVTSSASGPPQPPALVAIDSNTGEEIWRYELPGQSPGPTEIDGDLVFVRGSVLQDNGTVNVLAALDRLTGAERWRRSIPSGFDNWTTEPTVIDGTLYISEGVSLFAFDPTTGDERWHVRTGGIVSNSPVAGGSTLLVGTSDGYLSAIDPGVVDATAPAGIAEGGSPPIPAVHLIDTPLIPRESDDNVIAGLWRVTVAPGASGTLLASDHAIAVRVESGAVHVDLVDPSRSGDVFGAYPKILGVGDSDLIRTDPALLIRNELSVPAVVLAGAVVDLAAVNLQANQPGLSIEPVAILTTPSPTRGIALEASRYSFPPNGSLAPKLVVWPELILVESGELDLAVIGGQASAVTVDGAPVETGSATRMRAGQIAAVPAGSLYTAVNANQGPLTIVVVEVAGDIRGRTGGAGGCGGRCLSVRSRDR